jgi:hypothetical protein
MRYLKPNHKIIVNGKEYPLIFSLELIDELQDMSKCPMNRIMLMLTESKRKKTIVQTILKLITGEIIEENIELYSIQLLNIYIDQLKYKDMPELKPTEEEPQYEFIDVEYWFYVGKTVLGYSEEEVWKKTIGALRTHQREHHKATGVIKEDKVVNVDDAIPY